MWKSSVDLQSTELDRGFRQNQHQEGVHTEGLFQLLAKGAAAVTDGAKKGLGVGKTTAQKAEDKTFVQQAIADALEAHAEYNTANKIDFKKEILDVEGFKKHMIAALINVIPGFLIALDSKKSTPLEKVKALLDLENAFSERMSESAKENLKAETQLLSVWVESNMRHKDEGLEKLIQMFEQNGLTPAIVAKIRGQKK